MLFSTLIIFPLIYTNTNFYVCPVEKTNSHNASVCEARTLTFGEGVRQSLATATLQTVEMRKPNSPARNIYDSRKDFCAFGKPRFWRWRVRRKFMR